MQQISTTIFKTGNSSAVRINKQIAEKSGLTNGQEVVVTFNEKDGSINISKKKSNFHDGFMDILKERLDKNQDVMEFLKDK